MLFIGIEGEKLSGFRNDFQIRVDGICKGKTEINQSAKNRKYHKQRHRTSNNTNTCNPVDGINGGIFTVTFEVTLGDVK